MDGWACVRVLLKSLQCPACKSFCECSGNTLHNYDRVPLRQSNLSIRPASDADIPIAHAGALEIATFFYHQKLVNKS